MDEKIKEVMGLVDKQTGQFLAMLKLFNEGKVEGGEDAAAKARETRTLVESKIRELVPVWLPIESAPKDGQKVLGGFQSPNGWVQTIAYATYSHGVYADGYKAFSHWMPLQKEPTK